MSQTVMVAESWNGKKEAYHGVNGHNRASRPDDSDGDDFHDDLGSGSKQSLLGGSGREKRKDLSSFPSTGSGSFEGRAVRRRTPPPPGGSSSSQLSSSSQERNEDHHVHHGHRTNPTTSHGVVAVEEFELEDFNPRSRDPGEKNARAARALALAIVFCFVFMVAEAIGGIISNSLAVLTDAAHMLTDVAALCLALFAIHASGRPADENYTYGWQRAEAVGALASVFTIWALVGGIVISAISRIISDFKCARYSHGAELDHSSGCEAVDAVSMCVIGIAGFVANICLAAILAWGGAPHSHMGEKCSGGHDHGHSHGGGGDHGHCHSHGGNACSGDESHQKEANKHEENLNVRGAFLHALGDCIQSAGVVLAAIFIWIYNEHVHGSSSYAHSWGNLADPCCSILFGVITLYTTIQLFKDLLRILMQGTPRGICMEKVSQSLSSIPGVVSVQDLHIWSLTTDADTVVLSVHLLVGEEQSAANHQEILRAAKQMLGSEKFGIQRTTIQIDSQQSAQVSSSRQVPCQGHHSVD